ncbi:MAG TPA: hypothetical protein VF117_03010 [Gammaproteobacteria bacterium]
MPLVQIKSDCFSGFELLATWLAFDDPSAWVVAGCPGEVAQAEITDARPIARIHRVMIFS